MLRCISFQEIQENLQNRTSFKSDWCDLDGKQERTTLYLGACITALLSRIAWTTITEKVVFGYADRVDITNLLQITTGKGLTLNRQSLSSSVQLWCNWQSTKTILFFPGSRIKENDNKESLELSVQLQTKHHQLWKQGTHLRNISVEYSCQSGSLLEEAKIVESR